AAPAATRAHPTPHDPSWTDSTEVGMFESRSTWWLSNPSRVFTGLASRPLQLRLQQQEKYMARPIRLCLFSVLILAAALAALGLPAPSTAEAKKVVNIAAKEPDTLYPHSSTLGQSQAISRFMFRGLTRFAIKNGKVTTAEVEPDLAESWTL